MSISTEKLQAILDAATPGPWFWKYGETGGYDAPPEWDGSFVVGGSVPIDGAQCFASIGGNGWGEPEATLIALAPDLAREVLDLRAEVERLRRILAVERGDESQAPDGWSRSFVLENECPGIWPAEKWTREGSTVWRGLAVYGDDWCWYWAVGVSVGTEAPTALEAMEAADAAQKASP